MLLYQLLTGRVPFDGETPLQIVMQHVRDAPRPPREIAPHLDARLEAIVLRALAKLPSERHQSAAELESELAALLPELSTTRLALATVGPVDASGAMASRKRRRRSPSRPRRARRRASGRW